MTQFKESLSFYCDNNSLLALSTTQFIMIGPNKLKWIDIYQGEA